VVSLGTEWLNPVSLQSASVSAVMRACADIALDAQTTADDFEADYFGTRLSMDGKYFRFNVQQGMQDVELGEDDALTNNYLSGVDIAEKIQQCARKLVSLHNAN
jgi:hypothetical protein